MKEVLLRLLYAVVLMGGCVWVGGWLASLARHALHRLRVDPLVADLLARMVRPLVIGIGLAGALVILELDGAATTLAALMGGVSVGLGLGLKGYLSDVAAGTFLLTNRPFDRGDQVTLAGQSGVVAELGLFATRLELPDGNTAYVPNSKVTGGPILNFSDRNTRRVQVEVPIPRDADLDEALARGREALDRCEGTKPEPAPKVTLTDVTGSGSTLTLTAWATNADHARARASLLAAVHAIFRT